jgi:hypothetical protein
MGNRTQRAVTVLGHITSATHVLSLAEADILGTGGSLVASTLVGALADLPTALPALLIEAGLNAVRRLSQSGRQRLAGVIAGALGQKLCGPTAYTYVTRHTSLVHACRHSPHSGDTPALSCHQVGVDGSLRELPDGTLSAAGSAVYYTTVRGGNEQVAHIVTCTFDGDQTVANAECSACTLALQTLSHVGNVEIGWDHLNAVTLVHQREPGTAPAPPLGGGGPQPPRPRH